MKVVHDNRATLYLDSEEVKEAIKTYILSRLSGDNINRIDINKLQIGSIEVWANGEGEATAQVNCVVEQ